jgi:hypothetical protein
MDRVAVLLYPVLWILLQIVLYMVIHHVFTPVSLAGSFVFIRVEFRCVCEGVFRCCGIVHVAAHLLRSQRRPTIDPKTDYPGSCGFTLSFTHVLENE